VDLLHRRWYGPVRGPGERVFPWRPDGRSDGTRRPLVAGHRELRAGGLRRPDRGFGTGAWDYAAGLSLSKALGRTFLFGDASYWVLGDLPDLDLDNTVGYGLGVGRLVADGRVGLLASLSGYTTIIPDVDPPVQAGLGLDYRFENGRSLSAGVGLGLTDAASDVSFSLGWRMPL
jgi:hypothetical protein